MKNKKGFTLIELLATIVIIGVVLAISIVGVTSYLNKSEEKANLITRTSLLSSAQKYAKEYYDDDDWHQMTEEIDSDIETTCVNIDQLIGSGYLDEKKMSDFENDNRYLILKRNKNSKTITDKSFADFDGVTFCRGIRPEIVDNITKFTNRIEATYEIPNKLVENDDNSIVREIDFKNSKIIFYKNDEVIKEEYLSVIKENKINDEDIEYNYISESDELINLELIYKNLVNTHKYKIQVSIKYVYYKDTENEKDQVIDNFNNIKLYKLEKPIISVSNIDNWSKEKEVEVIFDNSNIYSGYENTYLQLAPNSSNINQLDLDINQLNLSDVLLTSEDTKTFEISYSSIQFVVNDNTKINAILTDGTNSINEVYEISNIDNHNYVCEISNNDKNLTLKVNDTTTPSNNINSDIVKEFKWGESGEYEKFRGGSSNIIDTITVDEYDTYYAYVKTRTGDVISCETTIKEPEAPNLNFVTKSGDKVLTDTATKWYSGTIITNITTDNDATISYCIAEINENCTPDDYTVSEMPITFTPSGNYGTGEFKIIAEAKRGDKVTNGEKIIKIDNTKPNAPTSKVIKYSDGSDVTDKFLKNENWKQSKVKWYNFSAKDNGNNYTGVDGTIAKYQYIEYHNKSTGTVTCDVTDSNSGVKTLSKSEYFYENKDFVFCIRAVDKAGNESEWKGPYYFRIDNEAPSIKLTFTSNGKSYTSKDWTSSDVKLTATTTKNGLSDVSSKCTIEEKTTDSYTNKQTKSFTSSLTHTLTTDSSLKYRIKCYAENAAGVKTYASGDDNNYNYVYIDTVAPSIKSFNLTSNGNTYTSADWVNKDVSLSMSSSKKGLSSVTNVCKIYTKDVENRFSNNTYELARTETNESALSYVFRNNNQHKVKCYAENAAGVKSYAEGDKNNDNYVYIDKILPYFKLNESNFNKYGDYPWHQGGYYVNDTSLSVKDASKVHRFGLCLQSIAKVSYGFKKKTDYDNNIPTGHRAITECSNNFVNLTVASGDARITGYTVKSFKYEYYDSNDNLLKNESNSSYNVSSGFYFGLSNESGYKNAKYVIVTIKVADPAGNTCARKFKVSFSKDGVNNASETDIKAVSTSGYCLVNGNEVKVDDTVLKYRY